MNKRVKRLWLKELRSGEYEQGKGTLRQKGQKNDYAYCCLGVLEKIRCDEKRLQRFPKRDTLTEATRKWAGLDENNPDLPNDHRSLAELNDNGMSFKAIAARIEKYL